LAEDATPADVETRRVELRRRESGDLCAIDIEALSSPYRPQDRSGGANRAAADFNRRMGESLRTSGSATGERQAGR
jgi:hypothetical protein